ncbi:hypothetical protein TPA0907_12210 [Micromonospora humidisoli]|nr:hypothetical protein TPA0907_12210 [Micromonospora sp. AKA109]
MVTRTPDVPGAVIRGRGRGGVRGSARRPVAVSVTAAGQDEHDGHPDGGEGEAQRGDVAAHEWLRWRLDGPRGGRNRRDWSGRAHEVVTGLLHRGVPARDGSTDRSAGRGRERVVTGSGSWVSSTD